MHVFGIYYMRMVIPIVDCESHQVKIGMSSCTCCLPTLLGKDDGQLDRGPSLKHLIGTAEIAALRGPDRNGMYNIKTKKSLRGGGDGTIGRWRLNCRCRLYQVRWWTTATIYRQSYQDDSDGSRHSTTHWKSS